mgnify:CR=1 FL=1
MVSSDKDFKPNIFQLFTFATVTIYEEFKDSEHPMDLLDSIEDRFDEMCEEFLDNILSLSKRLYVPIFSKKGLMVQLIKKEYWSWLGKLSQH